MRSVLIALATLAGAQFPASAQPVIQAVPERPRIVVDGYGEVKTPPDLAIIGYTVRGEGTTSDDAVRAMTSSGERIEAALRRIDREAEPKTGDVKVTPVKSDACKENEGAATQLSSGPCAVLGYVATQSVTVRTGAVADAGTMVGLVGRGGGFDARIGSFDFRDARTAQQQAIGAAINDARIKAAGIAAATHVSLANILSINTAPRGEGQSIVVTGIRRSSAELDEAVQRIPPVVVRMTPEPITTTANVTVTYAITQ